MIDLRKLLEELERGLGELEGGAGSPPETAASLAGLLQRRGELEAAGLSSRLQALLERARRGPAVVALAAALRTGRDPAATPDWWWSLPSGCPPDALLAGSEPLAPEQQRLLAEHLPGCPGCAGTARWLGRLEALLGGAPEGHPASARLTAHAAGELDAAERSLLAAHLASCESCRRLEQAARSGLEEADRIEQGLALQAALASRPLPAATAPAGPVHLYLPLHLPAPPPRALAASQPAELAPEVADRQVLLEEPGLYSLVYYRSGVGGRLGFFSPALAELELALQLAGELLRPDQREEGALGFALGPVLQLAEKELELELRQAGELRLRARFRLLPELPP